MTKQLVQIMMAVVLAASGMVLISGCQNDAMTGGAIGSLAGAGIGQLAGGDTEATLIGAAVGAGAGMDVQVNFQRNGLPGIPVHDIPVFRGIFGGIDYQMDNVEAGIPAL